MISGLFSGLLLAFLCFGVLFVVAGIISGIAHIISNNSAQYDNRRSRETTRRILKYDRSASQRKFLRENP